MTKNVTSYSALLLCLFLACTPTIKKGIQDGVGSQQSEIKVDFEPSFRISKKTTHKIKKGQDYDFGYLKVLENRDKSNGQTIEIPVYIFKSRSEKPKADPIIYTVGGPGSSTMPSAQYMNYYKYLDDRDFIVVEQRGNFYAKPHLDCPEWSNAMYKYNLMREDSRSVDSLLENAATLCRERLIAQGIDLDAYNTNQIAADISDLTKVLGIDSYNLLTISYSTKIAQVLLRDYPEGIRSVVMDGALPLEVSFDEESVGNLLKKTNDLLSDCDLDQDCRQAFPNLKQRFFEFLRAKNEKPLILSIENPNNGKEETFSLKGEDLITVFSSASTGDVSSIPAEIDKLLKGDFSSAKNQLVQLFNQPGSGSGIGMRLSVWCAEEYPFNDQDIISRETSKYPEVLGLSPATFDKSICKIWSVKKVADIENRAVKSDLPVLLINGSYDEITPAEWASNMVQNLSNSHHLVFQGWKHTSTTYWGNPCAMQAANDFFNNPNEAPTPDCFSEITGPEFITE